MAYSSVADGTQFLSNILICVGKKKADNISWSSIWTHNVHGKGCKCQTAGLKDERDIISHNLNFSPIIRRIRASNVRNVTTFWPHRSNLRPWCSNSVLVVSNWLTPLTNAYLTPESYTSRLFSSKLDFYCYEQNKRTKQPMHTNYSLYNYATVIWQEKSKCG